MRRASSVKVPMRITSKPCSRFASLKHAPRYSLRTLRILFVDDYAMDEKTGAKIAKKTDPKELLGEVLPILESIKSFDADSLKSAFETHAESKDQKVFAYFPRCATRPVDKVAARSFAHACSHGSRTRGRTDQTLHSVVFCSKNNTTHIY